MNFVLKKIKKIIFPLLFILICLPVHADSFFENQTGLKATADKTGHTKQKIFNSADSIDYSAGRIIQILLSLVGVVFMIFLFYGGILWMTAGGTEKRIDRAKKIMSESIVGLLIVLLAYAVSYFVISIFSTGKILN